MNSLVMGKTINDVAITLIDAARLKSVEVGKIEPLSHSRMVMGVCVGPGEVSMLLTAGLVHATAYAASYEYEVTHAAKLNRIISRQLYRAIGGVGSARFNGGFAKIWEDLQRDLNSQEAVRRLGYDLRGDPSQIVIAVVRSCVEWVIRKINGTGYLPEYAQKHSKEYEGIVDEFRRFVLLASADINFDDCIVEGGFKAIDLEKLPPCNGKYDVFISYRRSDGGVYARLLYQELMHQGFRCFLDVDSVVNGEYNLQILSALKDAPHFLFLKSQESMNRLDDPDDHVRIELEAAMYFKRNVIVIAPSQVPRDMTRINLPAELEYLKNLRAYKLDVGETYDFCVRQLINCGIQAACKNL